MPHGETEIHWTIECSSEESRQRVSAILERATNPECIITDWVKGTLDGVELAAPEYYRLGNYFKEIRVSTVEDLPRFIRLVFCRRLNAGKAWEKLMEQIINAVQRTDNGASTRGEATGGRIH